ncbi:MAG: hypothetical protein IKM43_01845 [Clostridia bacterium]|nr:hypothetical protein [Clostridia bacterium]
MDLKKRLNSVIEQNKKVNPNYIKDVIKSDFYYLISNFFEVDFDDIMIEINPKNNKYSIKIECNGDRMKLVRMLP